MTNLCLEIYQQLWTVLLNDPQFRTTSGIEVGPNNTIRVDRGKVRPQKSTVAQDGDLPEVEIEPDENVDDGFGDTDDTRPSFGTVQGVSAGDEHEMTYGFIVRVTHRDSRIEEYSPLGEVLHKALAGYEFRKRSGLGYVQNTTVETTFDPAVDVRGTMRPQHEASVKVSVLV